MREEGEFLAFGADIEQPQREMLCLEMRHVRRRLQLYGQLKPLSVLVGLCLIRLRTGTREESASFKAQCFEALSFKARRRQDKFGMKVFITNDDGIRAVGIRALWTALREAGHTVYVVAPMRQQSGVGHSLTFFAPVQAVEYEEPDGFSGLAVYGTPTDCVKLALSTTLPTRPDMVISGVNGGSNIGPDVLYSGTVAAATEACHEGLPSLAISNHDMQNGDVFAKARHAVKLAEKIDWSKIPERRVINVNYPKCLLAEAKGVRVCPQTVAVWKNGYIERTDPRGSRYWWLSGEIPLETVNEGSDYDLLRKGYITVTPLRFNFNDEESLSRLKEMKL